MKKIYLVILLLISFSVLAKVNIYSKAVESLATDEVTFSIFKDSFDYQDPGNIFNKTFRDSSDATDAGGLILSFDRYWHKGRFDLGWQVNLGVMYNGGKGLFSGGTVSTTNINLWTLPLDLGLTTELHFFSVLGLQISGGPSVMGLVQNRSDYGPYESGKSRRQIGFGYYGIARLKLNLDRIFTYRAFKLFRSFTVTKLTLNLESRFQNYSSFPEDGFEISGTSFGIGFSFDYF